MAAAVAAIADGVREAEVAAASTAAMIRAGGDPPGFGPFIRPAARLGEEHTTWGEGRLPRRRAGVLRALGLRRRATTRRSGGWCVSARSRDGDAAMAEIGGEAFAAVVAALRPGARAREVYAAWQAVVDAAGLGALPAASLRLPGRHRACRRAGPAATR